MSYIEYDGVFFTISNMPPLSHEELWFIAKAYKNEISIINGVKPEYLATLWYHYHYFGCHYTQEMDTFLGRITQERKLYVF